MLCLRGLRDAGVAQSAGSTSTELLQDHTGFQEDSMSRTRSNKCVCRRQQKEDTLGYGPSLSSSVELGGVVAHPQWCRL